MKKLKETKTAKKGTALVLTAAMVLSLSSIAAIADTDPSDSNNPVEAEITTVQDDANTEETTAPVAEPEETINDAQQEETTDEEESTTVEETTNAEETTTEEETTAVDTTPAIGAKITVGNYVYKIAENNTVILKGFADGASATKVIVKNTITYNGIKYTVVKVGAGAFRNETGIKKVVIRKNVTDIAKNAFRGCTKLTKVTMRTGVTIIRKNAFRSCKKLKTVNITSTSLTEVKSNAFKSIKSGAVINVMNKATRILVKASVPANVKVNKM